MHVHVSPFPFPTFLTFLTMKIAVLVYDETSRTWGLFAFNRNSRRMPYDVEPTTALAVLLAEIDADPTRIFWG